MISRGYEDNLSLAKGEFKVGEMSGIKPRVQRDLIFSDDPSLVIEFNFFSLLLA